MLSEGCNCLIVRTDITHKNEKEKRKCSPQLRLIWYYMNEWSITITTTTLWCISIRKCTTNFNSSKRNTQHINIVGCIHHHPWPIYQPDWHFIFTPTFTQTHPSGRTQICVLPITPSQVESPQHHKVHSTRPQRVNISHNQRTQELKKPKYAMAWPATYVKTNDGE